MIDVSKYTSVYSVVTVSLQWKCYHQICLYHKTIAFVQSLLLMHSGHMECYRSAVSQLILSIRTFLVFSVYGPPEEAECKQDSAALKNKLLCILATAPSVCTLDLGRNGACVYDDWACRKIFSTILAEGKGHRCFYYKSFAILSRFRKFWNPGNIQFCQCILTLKVGIYIVKWSVLVF